MSDTRQPGLPLRRWKALALGAMVVIVALVPLQGLRGAATRPPDALSPDRAATFVGGAACAGCHEDAARAWQGSDHDNAMAEATEATVLGDFDDATLEHEGVTSRFYRRDGRYVVHTEGPGGEPGEFEVAYVFGVRPLQQYLVRFPGGRLQALTIAWDVPGQRWFHLYPGRRIPADDWLHWTRNAQNWNGMCAACHSTNLRKGYDAATDTYDTTWSEIDVSCEACHGPGSRHVAWAEIEPMARPDLADRGLVVPTTDLTAPEQVALCAPCHSRRSELGEYDHTGGVLLDHMLPSLLTEGLYHADGQILDEVYVYGSFLQSRMYQRGVRCSDCHDVHSLRLRGQGNALCLQCHAGEAYDAAGHHFHKKEVDGRPSEGALCVKCHMAEQPYMVVDWRADHSLRVPRPDLSLVLGTPNACSQAGCHADKPVAWSADAYRKWYGEARKPHYGTAFAAGRKGDVAAVPELERLASSELYPGIVRATALSLLAAHPGAAEGTVVPAALDAGDALVRRTAVDVLATEEPARRVELLAPLLFDPVKAVRMAAASALAGAPRSALEPYQQEALARAVAEYRGAMEASLDFASSGLNLGNLCLAQGRVEEAEAFYRQAIAVDDLFFPAKMNLAVLLGGRGRGHEAEALLREVLDAYPDRGEAAYSLGLLLVELGQPAEALERLKQACESLPRHARAHYNLGLLLQQQGRDGEAEAALRRALDLAPRDWDTLYALADHYLRHGRTGEARDIAERMIAAHPGQRLGHELKALTERR